MQSIKFFGLLLNFIFVFAAETEKEKPKDIPRSASSSPSSCDVVAKLLAAYAQNVTHFSQNYNNNYSASAPNYASQIAALYTVLNAAQSASAHNQGTSYSAPSTTYANSAGSSVYSSIGPSQAHGILKPKPSAPVSGYSTSVHSSSSSSGYAAPTSAPDSDYYIVGSSYSASGDSSLSAARTHPSSNYVVPSSAVAPNSGYKSAISNNAVTGYVHPTVAAAPVSSYAAPKSEFVSHPYTRYSNIATYNSNEKLQETPMGFNVRSYYTFHPEQQNRITSSIFKPQISGFEQSELVSAYGLPAPSFSSKVNPAVYTDGVSKPSIAHPPSSSTTYSDAIIQKSPLPTEGKLEYASQPSSATKTFGKGSLDLSTKEFYRALYAAKQQLNNEGLEKFTNFYETTDPASNFRSYYKDSPTDNNIDTAIVPVPVCPQNYLLSCQSSLTTVPCVPHSSVH